MPVPGDQEPTRGTDGTVESPQRIGPYQLLQRIGEGGMGEVWMAEQREPFRRTVAVKVIKVGMDTRQVVGRFEAERQALAVMDHPAIAKVLDAGATAQGRPYFVMEYVKGERITDYCDSRRLSTAERLRLFVRVCEGVQHAHQKGIIHRDLKPSNVLVTVQDGRPVPKIIDFGIAKATGHRLADRTAFTELGALVGTPEYMSPEQAEMSGLDVDTRSDIYSLGVLLYELLTGTLPFDPKVLRERALDEVRRVIREVDPPRPSTRVTEDPDSAEAARRRLSEPTRLASQLRGDLDWITMRALEKDRTRRYDTVMGLANDISRHLCNEPVSAGPPSAVYRARKFVRRHRVVVAAGAVVSVLLVALGATLTAYVVGRVRHAEQLRVALEAARMEAAKAERVSEFLEGLFESNDPDNARGEEITGRELLERGLRQADAMTGDPVMQAQLLASIARVYESLGEFAKARPLVERALSLREGSLGTGHADVASSRRRLGVLLRHLGDRTGSERELRAALAADRPRQEADAAAVGADLHELGHTLVELGRFEAGERLFREALALRRAALGGDHEDVADSLSGVAYARSRQGYPRDAVGLYAEALEINRKRLATGHPQVARSHQNLGVVLSDVGDYEEAAAHFETALSIYRTAYGARHPSIAVAINNLANLEARQGNLEAAERLFRETAGMRQAIFGDDHPATMRAMNNLASTLNRLGKLNESERLFRGLLERRGRLAGQDDTELATYQMNLGEVLRRLKRLDEAERITRRALDTLSKPGRKPLESATAMIGLGRIMADRGRMEEAERLVGDGLAIRRERLGADHPEVKRTESEFAALHARLAKSPAPARTSGTRKR